MVLTLDPLESLSLGGVMSIGRFARLAGLSPMESLQVVTRNPARLLGLDASIGTVTPSKDADLLVLDADPLDNPDNLRRVAAVFTRGVQVV